MTYIPQTASSHFIPCRYLDLGGGGGGLGSILGPIVYCGSGSVFQASNGRRNCDTRWYMLLLLVRYYNIGGSPGIIQS